ncbi:MAG: type IV pilus assembly protein PilM [Candidatus Cloacimonetes bacterium]|jgi:type IV pilus assembly protein PilM|nr:type IV pilus assembly protein PilM [Candidatus Cloacimonadota bacterium]MBT5419754.1 type IV pilus assembly protein PilM [Candidatus Cloacimonadota bacterium]
MAKTKTVKFKESIGLDIGNHSIKMVHLKKTHHGYKLLNCESLSTIPEGIEPVFSDLSPDRYGPILAQLIKTMKLKPKKIKHLVSSIGGDNTSIKQIKTIFLPDEELESALFFEAKKHLPISGAEMNLDYQVLNVEEKTNNMNILLASSTKALLTDHSNALSSAGLAPGIVDLESLAVANSYIFNTEEEEGVYVILNVGAFKTNMIIYSTASKFFARDIAYGGHNFTKDIMKKQKISYEEAERYKIENGLKESDTKKDKTSIIALDITEKNTAELIAQEVKRSLRFYVKEAGNSDFRKILLVGGSANLKGLPEFITEQLQIPAEVFNPFVNLEDSDRPGTTNDPQFAIALGLAMRPE